MSPARKHDESLSGVVKIVIVVMIVCLGLWGCARKPIGSATSPERVRTLESRCQKLEQDYRQVAGARDQARTELNRLQKEAEDRDQLYKASQTAREETQKLLVQRTNERDDLRQQVAQRVTECDALISRCEKFRKGLQSLLGDDQTPTSSPTSVTPTPPAAPTLGGL